MITHFVHHGAMLDVVILLILSQPFADPCLVVITYKMQYGRGVLTLLSDRVELFLELPFTNYDLGQSSYYYYQIDGGKCRNVQYINYREMTRSKCGEDGLQNT